MNKKTKKEKRSLTKREQFMFDLLSKATGPVSVDALLDGYKTYNAGNLVAAHIYKLRRKIADKYIIESVSGVGYQMFPV